MKAASTSGPKGNYEKSWDDKRAKAIASLLKSKRPCNSTK
jgi:hypothetical protein